MTFDKLINLRESRRPSGIMCVIANDKKISGVKDLIGTTVSVSRIRRLDGSGRIPVSCTIEKMGPNAGRTGYTKGGSIEIYSHNLEVIQEESKEYIRFKKKADFKKDKYNTDLIIEVLDEGIKFSNAAMVYLGISEGTSVSFIQYVTEHSSHWENVNLQVDLEGEGEYLVKDSQIKDKSLSKLLREVFKTWGSSVTHLEVGTIPVTRKDTFFSFSMIATEKYMSKEDKEKRTKKVKSKKHTKSFNSALIEEAASQGFLSQDAIERFGGTPLPTETLG